MQQILQPGRTRRGSLDPYSKGQLYDFGIVFLNLFVHIYEGPNEEPTWCRLPAQRKAHHYRRYFNAHSTRFVHLPIILFLFADERQLWELHCMGLYSREHTTIQVSVIFF